MNKFILFLLSQHPELTETIEGVSEQEIHDLEALCPFPPIPDVFRVILKYMGKKSGDIKAIRSVVVHAADGLNSTIETELDMSFSCLFKYYKEQKRKWNFRGLTIVEDYKQDPKKFFLFALNPLGNDTGHFFLDLPTEKLAVYEISTTLFIERSPSLLEFLFKKSFKREVSTYLHNKTWL